MRRREGCLVVLAAAGVCAAVAIPNPFVDAACLIVAVAAGALAIASAART